MDVVKLKKKQDHTEEMDFVLSKVDESRKWFVSVVCGYFAEQWEAKRPIGPVSRLPPIALKLVWEDIIFVLKPGLCYEGLNRRLDTDKIHVEFVGAGKITLYRHPVASGEARIGNWRQWYRDGRTSKALEVFARLMPAFVADPFQVFGVSRDWCCNCCRRLTDEVSRCRGIGPECLGRITDYFAKDRNY